VSSGETIHSADEIPSVVTKSRHRAAPREVPASVERPREPWVPWVWAVALVAAVIPLWAARDLPMVDLPQHLYVLEAMKHLHDAATPYPVTLEFHAHYTPYLGYYAVVGSLATFLPLEAANRIWLTLVVLAYPLSMAFLLGSMRRPTWPALLAAPLAYGDSFAWGFVNTLGATPLAVMATAAFIRAIDRPPERRRWSLVFAGTALASFFTHPAPVAYLALALPWLLLTTPAPEDTQANGARGWLARRGMLLAGAACLALAVGAWLVTSGAEGGGEHSALRAILAREDVVRETLRANLGAFLWLLANQFRDNTDEIPLLATMIILVIAPITRLFEDPPPHAPRATARGRLRPLGLVAIAFGLFLALPLTVRGQIMYLSPRFAALTAMLALALAPRLGARSMRVLFACSALTVILSGAVLTRGFRAFSSEASALRQLASACSDGPRVLGLIVDPHSQVVWRPVYLHGAAVLARLRHGTPGYSLVGGQQIPLRYRGTPPPSLPSEWEPRGLDLDRLGHAYDHFLLRGASPDSVFGARLGSELVVAGRAGEWALVRRKD
jgi:hypothetical protein